MTTHGLVVGGPYAFLPALGQEAEKRGFDTVWVAETTQDSIVQAAALATATESITIGTNITLAFPRSPAATALTVWDLNELSGERFVIGLGSQVKRIIEDRFGADFSKPAKRMAEYVQVMQACWKMWMGEREDAFFEGELLSVTHPGIGGFMNVKNRTMPRVNVAAVGPLMTKAAATHADGILGHPFTSLPYLEHDVVPRIESALDEAGRSRDEFQISQGIILSIAEDRQVAIDEAKGQIAFYGTTPNYKPVFASHGDEALMDTLRTVFKQTKGDRDAMVAAVPDDIVQKYAVAGTPDEVKDRLADYEQHVDHLILGGAWWKVGSQRLAENLFAIMETFGA